MRDDIIYVNTKSEDSICDVVDRGIKGFVLNSTRSDKVRKELNYLLSDGYVAILDK